MDKALKILLSLNNLFEERPKEKKVQYHYISPFRIILENFPILIPNDLKAFYQRIGYAELFVDGIHGQSGIRLYNPYQALQATELVKNEEGIELLKDELIIGEFLGDTDRILLSNNMITILLPIYTRQDWLHTCLTFERFLEKMIVYKGEKYWEV
jgi:hypothetical protein